MHMLSDIFSIFSNILRIISTFATVDLRKLLFIKLFYLLLELLKPLLTIDKRGLSLLLLLENFL